MNRKTHESRFRQGKRRGNQEHGPDQISENGSENATEASGEENPEGSGVAEHGWALELMGKAFISKIETGVEDRKLRGGHQCNQP